MISITGYTRDVDRGFLFVGRLCLDFAHTGAVENWRRVFEVLHAPADLARWFGESSLGLPGLQVTRRDLVAAQRLREALLQLVDAQVAGAPLPAGAVAAVNACAHQPDLAPELVGPGVSRMAVATAPHALATIARDAVRLFGRPEELARMRECASDDCGVVIYDSSRPGRRRWCGRCADRVRARAYRVRRRSKEEPG